MENRKTLPPIQVGGWVATEAVERTRDGRMELWEVVPDTQHPLWTDTSQHGRQFQEQIKEVTDPAGGSALMKLVGPLDFAAPNLSYVAKVNRELRFADSQRIDHRFDAPKHLVTTLAVEDLLASDDERQPTLETISQRRDELPFAERRFHRFRAAIVMVKYAPMSVSEDFNSNRRFFDRLVNRLLHGLEPGDPDPVVGKAVESWLADPRYQHAMSVPRAVLAHSLLRIAWQVLCGFAEAEERFKGDREATFSGFRHRDVKPDNLFVDHEGRVRLGDFSHSIEADDSGPSSDRKIGFWPFAPPEALLGELSLSQRGSSEDVWTLGMTLADLWLTALQWVPPFRPAYRYRLPLGNREHTSNPERAEHISDHDRHVELFETMPKPLAAVIAAMLIPDRDKRLSRSEAFQLVEVALSPDPVAEFGSPLPSPMSAISGVKLAQLASADETVATAIATAGARNLDRELRRAANLRTQLDQLADLGRDGPAP